MARTEATKWSLAFNDEDLYTVGKTQADITENQ